MPHPDYHALFTPEVLQRLLPAQRADQFFEALYGEIEEGAYDIRLVYKRHDPGRRIPWNSIWSSRNAPESAWPVT